MLSHDLLEGCHARAGLLTDVSCTRNIPASTPLTSAGGTAGFGATGS